MSAKTSRGLGGGAVLSCHCFHCRPLQGILLTGLLLLLLSFDVAVSFLGWTRYNIDGLHAETLHSFYKPHGNIYAVFWGLQRTPRNIGGRLYMFRRCFFPFFLAFGFMGLKTILAVKPTNQQCITVLALTVMMRTVLGAVAMVAVAAIITSVKKGWDAG